jgi:GT2 family glycosyltransferase
MSVDNSPQAHPRVAVLILSYNGKELLEESVSSYLANDYSNFCVVVVDNGSVDGTAGYVKQTFPNADLLRIEDNRGYSGGFNVGLEYAFRELGVDYALVTNNDVKADSAVVRRLVEVAQTDEAIGFVTGKVYYYDHPDVFQTVGKGEDPVRWNGGSIGRGKKDEGQFEEIVERPFADDVFTLVSKPLYDAVGGYDPEFFLQCEEYDWQARAKLEGFRIMYTPHAKIWHKESMTIGKTSPLKAYYDARNPMIVIMKHKSPEFFKRYMRIHFWRSIFKGSLRIVWRNFEVRRAFSMWRGFFSALRWGFKHKKLGKSHFI